ncbi:hypothetical protein COCSUDRAFT_33205 [Coccomyxa subellipsoidea C-169]|uniref:Uncharacterized protein n=1 Tax=Coccomyxa subellipsoidea (strain C-169) TaxID=574566 RepID=I0YX37_COCSC|nr:hypothetical protein COCSUDRAFT_33205 [Coccomyxa subellipsoidea C-169]EIE22956.1 hypothetical protein COCSUDRAFT_33205 [Coccomyxa subellipsoidea C-169]|eukprot:XP_005647500.1 hypothetical protein COCSUDRAFT_33205 [Coccomyxa subellipsoidea C-169]
MLDLLSWVERASEAYRSALLARKFWAANGLPILNSRSNLKCQTLISQSQSLCCKNIHIESQDRFSAEFDIKCEAPRLLS